MYFPYLRGRQYELIAIRELIESNCMSTRVIPIIEPVKISSTLIKMIENLKEQDKKIALIMNPQVGNFNKDLQEEKNIDLKERFYKGIKENSNLIFVTILSPDVKSANSFVEGCPGEMMTICTDRDAISVYEEVFSGLDVKYNVIPDETGFRRKIRKNRVMLDNKFKKLERNTDYADLDEPFSEDHLFYKEDGYLGFADYSIVGDEYSDTGFAPYAVAIHIVYFAEDQSLRIAHFVSDSNDDITDPAGKFKEALDKLIKWNESKKLETMGIKLFKDLYEREAYPGLGTVKKLSIMHHLELISQFLDRGDI